jgi:curved DNA-binding protein CbpA
MADPDHDHYEVLGIARDATIQQVKAAYRKLAKKHHPDASPGDPNAAARFRDITEAYETLSDPDRRKAYDRTYMPPGMPITYPGEGTLLSVLLAVLEETWREIRHHHPEVPPVVVIIASGTETRQAKWGHYASGRWYADNIKHAEVMISGEGLRREPLPVLGTLLHEAAHSLAACRGIQDTSRQGRYHNKKYALLARELGLDVAEDTQFGWTVTTVPGATVTRYETQLAHLKAAMTMWRGGEHHTRTVKRDTNLIAASCPCGRKIRVAASTLKEAPIQCQACDGTFEPASTL